MTSRAPNIQLRPNVICTELLDDKERVVASCPDKEIEARVSYWERLKLKSAYPFRFSMPYLGSGNMTRSQIAQMAAFMREGSESIWPGFDHFRPMPANRPAPPGGERSERGADTDASPADDKRVKGSTEDAGISETPSGVLPRVATDSVGDDRTVDSPRMRDELVATASTGRIMVIAPPGTGKTHLLIERLVWLLQNGGIENPREELLVLSFTRAAVTEIVRRVLGRLGAGTADDLRFVNVRTFDSFATEMLLRELTGEGLAGLGYEARIERFTRMLNRPGVSKARDAVDKIRCLLVDEIQDLVGPRAEMVMALAERVIGHGGGVWLLGDPAQAIYDWQVEDHPMTSRAFLAGVREVLGEDRSEVELFTYHRFTTPRVMDLVRSARSAMGPDGTQPDGGALLGIVANIGEPLPLGALCEEIRSGQRAAILTRNNLEAYQAATYLRSRGVSVALRDDDRRWPAWIARLLLGFEQEQMGRRMAELRWGKLVATQERANFEEAWAYLAGEGLVRDDTIEVRLLSFRVQQRAPSSREEVEARCLVSTIHRSKGLEFDAVHILSPDGRPQGDAEELRVLYVAATRAKNALGLVKREREIFRYGKKKWLNRFHLYRKSQNFLLLDGLDCLDIESLVSVGDSSIERTRAVQEQLWQRFAGFPGHIEAAPRPGGLVFGLASTSNDDGYICRVSADLMSDLAQLARSYRANSRAPVRLERVPVCTLATVSLRDVPGAAEHLGAAACALAPVTYGEALVVLG